MFSLFMVKNEYWLLFPQLLLHIVERFDEHIKFAFFKRIDLVVGVKHWFPKAMAPAPKNFQQHSCSKNHRVQAAAIQNQEILHQIQHKNQIPVEMQESQTI